MSFTPVIETVEVTQTQTETKVETVPDVRISVVTQSVFLPATDFITVTHVRIHTYKHTYGILYVYIHTCNIHLFYSILSLHSSVTQSIKSIFSLITYEPFCPLITQSLSFSTFSSQQPKIVPEPTFLYKTQTIFKTVHAVDQAYGHPPPPPPGGLYGAPAETVYHTNFVTHTQLVTHTERVPDIQIHTQEVTRTQYNRVTEVLTEVVTQVVTELQTIQAKCGGYSYSVANASPLSVRLQRDATTSEDHRDVDNGGVEQLYASQE